MPEIIPNVHPIFVHFTVALLTVSSALFVVGFALKKTLSENWLSQLKVVAKWNLWLGAVVTLFTGLAGLYAFNTVAHDTPSHLAMIDHRNWAVAAIVLFLLMAGWSVMCRGYYSAAFVAAMMFSTLVLLSTAWHGGELVYRHGLGVMSLPKGEGDGHDHSHGHGEAHQMTEQEGHHERKSLPHNSQRKVTKDDHHQGKEKTHDDGHDHDHEH